MRFVDQTFEHTRVDVDGNQFERCTFARCKLVFAGGDGVSFVGCTFINCDWSFDGSANSTLVYLAEIYHGLGPEGSNLVERIFESIRSGAARHGGVHPVKTAS